MARPAPKLAKPRRRTGEKPKTVQPLSLDRLPQEVRDTIIELRTKGKTWPQIEEESREFVPWDTLAPLLVAKFPGRKIPHSNLHRWYDLRVEQVRKEVLAESETARAFAEKFSAASIENGNEAVMNAMRDAVFEFTKSIDPASKINFLKGLNQLALNMSRIQRVEIQRRKADVEMARIDAERARAAAEAGDPREIYLQASQDILKKLRTRKPVREVLDPISEELIQEMSHAAESFAKQVEASAAR